MSDLMSPEDARDILSRWKAEHQEALDLLSRRLASANASLVDMVRRAERAEAELARVTSELDALAVDGAQT